MNKDFPQTEKEKKIYQFWKIRGYIGKAIMGNQLVSFHKENPKYESNGLSYQYLEQFYNEAQKELLENKVFTILEELLYWDTCPDEYKKEIKKFLKKYSVSLETNNTSNKENK